MSTEETRAWMERYFEAVLAKEKTPELLAHYIDNDELAQHILLHEAAFPGYDISLEELIVEGNKAAMRGTLRGVHRGELMGIPPTGKTVELPLQVMFELKNGKIAEFWMSADTLALMQQLDAAPVPVSA